MGKTSQVVTVALNPALDQTITVAGLQSGAVNRALHMQMNAGGKAINVASCLADFGIRTAVTGQLGRDNAALFEALFRKKRIANHCDLFDGLTRTNIKLVDVTSGATTDVNMPGSPLTPVAAASVLRNVLQHLERLAESADWIVLSGSLPPGMPSDAYATLIQRMHCFGSNVVLDTSGMALQIGLAAAPYLIKPNRYELEELVGQSLETVAELVAAGRRLLEGRAAPTWVVISLGNEGALFITLEEALHAQALPIAVASSVGAGDAMVAGLVAARLAGCSVLETAQLATAFAAAKLGNSGAHLPHRERLYALAKQVVVVAVDPAQ